MKTQAIIIAPNHAAARRFAEHRLGLIPRPDPGYIAVTSTEEYDRTRGVGPEGIKVHVLESPAGDPMPFDGASLAINHLRARGFHGTSYRDW